MGQYIDIKRDEVDDQWESLNNWLQETVWTWGFMHEDMENVIDNCMTRWFQETEHRYYQEKLEEYENDEDKEDYDDFEEWVQSNEGSRWWTELMWDNDDNEEKYQLLWRYRQTIMAAMYSNTYNEDSIYDDIDSYLGEDHQ